jgi:hypothetical protein
MNANTFIFAAKYLINNMKKFYFSILTLAMSAMSMVYAQERGGCLSVFADCPNDIVVQADEEGCVAVVNYNGPVVYNYCNQTNQTVTFNYTGDVQIFTVPEHVYELTVNAFGAQGGTGGSANNPGGLGGHTQGILAVEPGQVFHIYVGGRGTNRDEVGGFENAPGGWNGGGYGGYDPTQTGEVGGGGGGATDIRYAENTTLAGRIMVAAGGGGGAGGAFSPANGGAGGGETGQAGGFTYTAMGGGGGTQTEGGTVDNIYGATNGSLGLGGNGATNAPDPSAWGSGGGGAGYYGGAGGTNTQLHGSGHAGAGGGGSSYLSPSFLSPLNFSGINSGNGYVVIHYVEPEVVTPTLTAGLASGSVFPLGTTTVAY